MKITKFGNSRKFADTIFDVVRNTNVKSIDVKYYDYHNTPYISHIDVLFNGTDKYVLDYEFDLDNVTYTFLVRCKKYASDLDMLKKAIRSYVFSIYNI